MEDIMEFVPREEFELYLKTQNGRLEKIEASLKAIWEKIDGRPSWAVLMVISFLATLCGIFMTSLISMYLKGE